jgi:multiple sugar transport system permease protein
MSILSRIWPKSKLARKEALAFYAFIAPWLIGFTAFTLYPMIASAYYSLTVYNVVEMRFVGLQNFRELIADDKFYWSLWVTAKFTLVGVPLGITAALAVAVLLNQKVPFLSFWRTLYYLPSVISGVAVALLWRWVFNPEFGLANFFLGKFGIEGPRWFYSEQWVIPSYWIMGVWGIGGAMVIYLAGLQGVPTSLYEAAEIDGASSWQRFWTITIPMISPVILFTLVTNLIGALQTFTQVYVISNGLGGPNNASLLYVLYMFLQGFRWFRLGYASALAWVLFFIIVALTYLMLRASRNLVYYESAGA